MDNNDGFGLIEIILVTILLVLVAWMLSVEFAMSANHNRFGGITAKIAEQTNHRERDYTVKTTVKEIEGTRVDDGGEAYREFFGYIPMQEEFDLLYRVVMAEGGYTEPDEGLARIADVIGNRCLDPCFPDTITEVITQQNQFETYSTGRIWDYEPTERVKDAVTREIVYGKADTEVLFFTAEGYNPYCIPMYQLGNHYFGK